jgi:Kdo2-lipid IVA lauroyltransferase/acyltransferase
MYYVVFGLFYLLSLLPLRVLYLFSDLGYVLVYHVLGYRKRVVMDNLSIAFPQKTEAERIKIAKGFYRNFLDTLIETIKFFSASRRFFQRHTGGNFNVLEEAYKAGRPVQILLGHNFNWELMNLAVLPYFPGDALAVYLPLDNKLFNRLFYYLRSRFGTHMIAATKMTKDMLPFRGKQYTIALIADQSPPAAAPAYWTAFFNKPTGFIKGPERFARRNNFPVILAHITKIKRGHYQYHMELATMEPTTLPEGELTRRYAHFLERVMTEYPEMWLWSHRRWKNQWTPEKGRLIE